MRKKKEPFPPKEGAKEGTGMAPAWKVIRASESPLIDRSHEGSADNECGYENGYVIEDGRGTYHMLITEMFTRGKKKANGWVPARIGYWTSADGTLRYGSLDDEMKDGLTTLNKYAVDGILRSN